MSHFHGNTTNATPTTLLQIPMRPGDLIVVELICTAWRDDTRSMITKVTDTFHYHPVNEMERVGSPTVHYTRSVGSPNWAVSFVDDVDRLRVQVVGEAGVTVRWNGVVRATIAREDQLPWLAAKIDIQPFV